jgi:transcriptional regulator with XRE-family HTH domain
MKGLNIGAKIREIRTHRRLTLETVAKSAGFTRGYLSMVELGKKSPPIASLAKMAHALNIDIAELFDDKKPEERFAVTRWKERKPVVRNGTSFGYKYESLASAMRNRRMDPFIITYPDRNRGDSGGKLKWFDHEGDEFLFVLQGALNVYLEDKKYTLKKGDSIYFDSSIRHAGEGIAKVPAIALVMVFSPGINKR